MCDCGNVTFHDTDHLRSGKTKSCGCLQKQLSREIAAKLGRECAKDITNRKFGRLTALRPTKMRSGRSIYWECKCVCGSMTLVLCGQLCIGEIKSCGCLKTATDFAKNTNIDPMDVPFEITNIMRARRELSKAIEGK